MIHREAYRQLGLTDWRYDAVEVDAAGFAAFLDTCGPQWVGLSCTMPLKEEILRHGEVEATASLLRSANTYLFARDGRLARVANTDVAGIAGPLGGATVASASLIGAGATARSALAALAGLGVRDVRVQARSAERARVSLDALAATLDVHLTLLGWDAAPPPTDLVVSTLPVPLDADRSAAWADAASTVFDIAYGHGPSPLVEAGLRRGRRTLDGLDMLVAQAVEQVELMTGRRPAPEPLVDAARRARRQG